MFYSAAVRPISQENPGSVAAKKLEDVEKTRKPFRDISVNGKSPLLLSPKNFKATVQPLQPVKLIEAPVKLTEDDDLFGVDTCSYQDVEDTYPDAYYRALTRQGAIDILSSYCSYRTLKTPPPELDVSDEEFVELPEHNIFATLDAKFSILDKMESNFNVSIPQIDTDEDDDDSFTSV